jgi:hypothetical protein
MMSLAGVVGDKVATKHYYCTVYYTDLKFCRYARFFQLPRMPFCHCANCRSQKKKKKEKKTAIDMTFFGKEKGRLELRNLLRTPRKRKHCQLLPPKQPKTALPLIYAELIKTMSSSRWT